VRTTPLSPSLPNHQLPPASDPELRLVSTAVGDIAITDEGLRSGPALLCIHGIPGSSRDFRYLAPLLSDVFRVIRLEMPGFGLSPPGASTLDGWAAVPSAVTDALDLEQVIVLGHSFGGGAALLAAARSPNSTSGLALLASMGRRIHRGMGAPPAHYRLMVLALRLPLLRSLLLWQARRHYRRMRLPGPESLDELLLHLRLVSSVCFSALSAAARTVPCPVVTAFCADDRLVQVEIQRETAALLSDVDVLEFPDGGHHLQKSRVNDIAPALIRRFAHH
jgi:pimeloyl-ACP methyl ester carboxylesterase